jgi:hypothetical protein
MGKGRERDAAGETCGVLAVAGGFSGPFMLFSQE